MTDNVYSVYFDRASSYAYVASDLGIAGGAATFSAWVKPQSTPSGGARYFLFSQGDAGVDVYFRIEYFDDTGTPSLRFSRSKAGVGSDTIVYAVTLPTDAWSLLTFGYDGSRLFLYVDGVSVAAAAASGSGSSAINDQFVIGTEYDETVFDTTNEWQGDVDEFLVYNASSTDEISHWYSEPCTLDENNLVAEYRFENDYTDSFGAYDLTGNNSPPMSEDPAFSCGIEPPAVTTASSTLASTTEMMVQGFLGVIFGLAILIFLVMLFVTGYLYNNLIKPAYGR